MSQETKSSILTQSCLKSFSCFILTINHFTAKSPQREGTVFTGLFLGRNTDKPFLRIFTINCQLNVNFIGKFSKLKSN